MESLPRDQVRVRFFLALTLTALVDGVSGLAAIIAMVGAGWTIFALTGSLFWAFVGGPLVAVLVLTVGAGLLRRRLSWRDPIFAHFGFGAAPSRPNESGARLHALGYALVSGLPVLPAVFCVTALILILAFHRTVDDAFQLIVLFEILVGGPTFLMVFFSAYERAKGEFTPKEDPSDLDARLARSFRDQMKRP